jgi:hypothetical protein
LIPSLHCDTLSVGGKSFSAPAPGPASGVGVSGAEGSRTPKGKDGKPFPTPRHRPGLQTGNFFLRPLRVLCCLAAMVRRRVRTLTDSAPIARSVSRRILRRVRNGVSDSRVLMAPMIARGRVAVLLPVVRRSPGQRKSPREPRGKRSGNYFAGRSPVVSPVALARSWITGHTAQTQYK